ncbi:MAG: SIS domain-containing protein [Candidatus Dependentiae bacterium]|jgi:glucose/mannose-6-phosphate isomerase
MQECIAQWSSALVRSAQVVSEQPHLLASLRAAKITNVAFVGMGGSGIAGRLIKLLLSVESALPISVVEGIQLPRQCDVETLLVVSSYSGNTWETVELFEQGLQRHIPMIVLASGGRLAQRAREEGVPLLAIPGGWVPRAALPIFLGSILSILENLGLYAGLRVVREWQQHWDAVGAQVADRAQYQELTMLLMDAPFCHVWGVTDDSDAVAYRLQTQLNENSKVAAVYSPFPELNHNLLVGFDQASRVAPLICVMSDFAPDLLKMSLASVENTLRANGIPLYKPALLGDTWRNQLAYVLWWADFASLYVGQTRGCDITQTRLIDSVKRTFSQKVHINEKECTS